MRILLTNDDGIDAPGLLALYQELKHDYEVHVVAPKMEMSAVGHAITLTAPLRIQEVYQNGSFFGHAVSGTPADCIKIAVRELFESRPPEVILSGINLGANVGVNVLYSGTVSAATEGAFLGIRSAAISLNTINDPDFGFAARFSRVLVRFMMEKGLKKGTALNVNIPAVPKDEIKGVCVTRQCTAGIYEHFEQRKDPRGNTYYWLSGERPMEASDSDTDSAVLKQNRITVTPVNCDLTSGEELKRLKAGESFSWNI